MPRRKALAADDSVSERNGTDNGIPEETPETTIPRTVASASSTRLTLADYHALSIFEAMEKMTEEDWSDKMLYIVRSMPYTVNKGEPTKKHGSIHKGGFPGMTKEEISDAFGGYKFHLWLKMGKATLCEGWHEVDADPKLLPTEQLVTPSETRQPAEAAASAGEASMAKVIQLLLEERKSKAEQVGDTQTANAMQKAIELVASGAQQAQAIIAKAGQAPTLNEQFDMAQKIMALAAPKEDSVSKALMLKLIDRAFAAPPTAGTTANPLDQIGSTMDLIDKLEEKFGGSTRGGSDWRGLLAQAAFKLMEHLPTLARAIQQRPVYVVNPTRYPGAGAPQAIPGYVPPPEASPTPDTRPLTPEQTFGGPPQPLDAPPALTPDTPPPTPALELAPIDQIQSRLVRMFYKGKGGDLAASFIEDAAPSLYERLKGKTVEELFLSLNVYPILAPLAGEPGIKEWLKELAEYIAEEEAETEEAPAPVGAVN